MTNASQLTGLQGIYSESETQQYPLGFKKEFSDGRVFRYAKAGAVALTAGDVQQSAAFLTNHHNATVSAAVAVGGKVVTPTLGATAATANFYRDGMLVVNDVAGEGHAYKIKSHPAADASATCAFTLYDGVVVALTTSSSVSPIVNKWNGTLICPTTITGAVAGVSPIAVTANYYYWCQTRGVAAVLTNGTPAIGVRVVTGGTTAGSVDIVATDAANEERTIVGVTVMTGISTDHCAIDLCLE